MKNPLFIKCALLALISVLLLIPLMLIEKTIAERESFRHQAISSIAASSAGKQTISGPVLMVKVIEEYDEIVERADLNTHVVKKTSTREKREHLLKKMPRQVNLEGQLNAERRAYGLYSAAVYEMQGILSGEFDMFSEKDLPSLGKNAHLTWGKPYLIVNISDMRGISGEPKSQLGDEVLSIEVKSPAQNRNAGFIAQSEKPVSGKVERQKFRIDLSLIGTSSFAFVPLGEISTAELRSNWLHPSFGGDFLPRSRDINAQGFRAQWGSTALANPFNTDEDLTHCGCGFRVQLIEPVDIYQQASRAVKYGILFIVLGFAAFFTFENLKNLPIHPIQYLFVGLAQALFFLLLTSLSEHIFFALAYLVAASASIALIAIYLAKILHSWRRSLGFSASLGFLYAALFGILQSEQNALLLGSLLLFAALAALMLSTRSIDWYALGKRDLKETSL